MENVLSSGTEPHPVIGLLEPEAIRAAGVDPLSYYRERAEAIALMAQQPLLYGFEPAVWALADQQLAELRAAFPTGVITLLVLGGNRASKTVYACKRIMRLLTRQARARTWCLQSTEAASRADQQPVVYDHLPLALRNESGKVRYGRTTKIVYSRAGGFTENTFVLPNESQNWFKFYGADVKTLEGAELDMAWADELIRPDWVEALRFRLLNRDGVMIITFTPIDGYTGTVKEFLDGAKTVLWEKAPLLPRRKRGDFEMVPRVQHCIKPTARIIYFHTSDNPYGNYPAMEVECRNSPRSRILTRAYGVPTKVAEAQFPLFSDQTHVLSARRWERIQEEPGARFQFVDPCSGRNWFMLWVYMTRRFKVIYREWPSYGHEGAYVPGVGDMGEWALPSNAADGARGPAQIEIGWSLQRYADEIMRLEKGENIFERWIDARYANARRVSTEEPTTLIEESRSIGLEFLAAPAEARVFSDKADGSLRMINGLLYYDQEQPLEGENQPKLFVLDTCPNVIYALRTWTGRDGQLGATKDPIDCVRMMVLSKSEYVDETFLRPKLPWLKQFSDAYPAS